MPKTRVLPYGLMVACCCGLAASSMGLGINSMGLFNGPVAQTLGVGIGDVSLFLTISNIVTGLSGPLVIALLRRLRLRPLLSAATVLLTLCYIGLSTATALWQMYGIAVIGGICKAILGSVTISMFVANWFEKRMGLAMGISMCATGVSAAILNPLLNGLITATSWRTAYLVCAVLNAVMVAPAILYVRATPGERGLPRFGQTEVEQPEPQATIRQLRKRDVPLALSAGLVMVIALSLFSSGLTGVGSHLVPFATSIGLSSALGAAMTSMTMFGNTGCKLAIGVLCDAISPKRACALMLGIAGVGIAILCFASTLPVPLLMVGAWMIGGSYSVGGVGISTVCRQVFGQEKFADVYAYVSAAGNTGNAVCIALIGYAYDGAGSYLPALLGMVLMSILSLVLLMVVYRSKEAKSV